MSFKNPRHFEECKYCPPDRLSDCLRCFTKHKLPNPYRCTCGELYSERTYAFKHAVDKKHKLYHIIDGKEKLVYIPNLGEALKEIAEVLAYESTNESQPSSEGKP